MIEDKIRGELFKLKDEEYKKFNLNIIPTVDSDLMIGVRMPFVRKLAKEVFKRGEHEKYLSLLPHKYYEENNLHGFLIEQIDDIDKVLEYIEEFLPYIDNWATCDSISPKVFKKHPELVYEKIKLWLKSNRTYTLRYGIVTLMGNYLEKDFKPEMLDRIKSIKSDEYYINMAIAWYFSVALVKQYKFAIPIIEEKSMDKFVHNKSIQKAIESRRVPQDRKDYLRSLKK